MQHPLTMRYAEGMLRWPNEIVYQILPDRFCNGDPSNDVQSGAYTWLGKPVRRSSDPRRLTSDSGHQHTFYGGDLAGIRQKIPYLLDLGVTAVYLNPIFASKSSHKYDTDDHFQIDPHLGTREDYDALVADLRQAGLKLILDGVFNHTSFDHPWYRDHAGTHYCLKRNGKPETWMDWGVMPKLDLDREEVVSALSEVVSYWPGVDAWRLDASHLLPERFLRRLRDRYDGLIIGEEWEHSGSAIDRGLYDGVTNFMFRKPLEAFFSRDLAAESLARRLSIVPETYPWHGAVQSWNFLGNHDTSRFYSQIGHRKGSMEMAIALMFTLPGTPMIYYGDEVGMRGQNAHQSRAPMLWNPDTWDARLHATFKRYIRMRREHAVLGTGSLRWVHAHNRSRTLAFVRESASEQALVILNAGEFDERIDALGRSWPIKAGQVRVEFL